VLDVKDLKSAFELLEQRQLRFELQFDDRVQSLKNIANSTIQVLSEVRSQFSTVEAQYKEVKVLAERAERLAKSRASSHDLSDARRLAERALEKAKDAEEEITESGQRAIVEQRNTLERANLELRNELAGIIKRGEDEKRERERERERERRKWKWTLVSAAVGLISAVSATWVTVSLLHVPVHP
jgi:vacuolar-type H+-ATPase subunit I/STV1